MLIAIMQDHFEPDVVAWDDFAADNAAAFDADELADMERTLRAGHPVEIGGGAAPLFTLTARAS